MRKALILAFALTLAATVLELAWIESSPVMGEGSLAEMTSNASLLDRMGGYDQLPGIFSAYYRNRLHRRDPYAGIYKLTLGGLENVEESTVGVYLWRSGITRQCGEEFYNRSKEDALEALYRYRPTAIASQFIPLNGMEGFERTSLRGTAWEGRTGKDFVWRDLGWLRLGDLSAGNSIFLFEDGCGAYNNMSGPMFLKEMADAYRVDFARTAYVESAYDGSSFGGILYMAYYPSFKGIWIVTYDMPEEEVRDAKVTVDGAAVPIRVVYPFIIADGELADGAHRLVLSTKRGEYALDFASETSPLNIEPLLTNMSSDGRLHIELTHLNYPLTLKTAQATLDQQTKAVFLGNRTLEPYETSSIDIDFGRRIEYNKTHTLEARISYDIGGKERWLNRTLM